ncbi:heat-inducible transcriptional repressor HrcA [Kiloniella sp. b19]|uniref:heat-inducible transcriptional repressor HrcA n=1 Tax=Kiloniella sp. GXU_MW_B19 TaxID=3141326 RepID=UPI0031DF034E
MNDRSREIFRKVVDAYVGTGEPVGSRTLSKMAGLNVSAATIRNVMADLEDMGLLFSRHTSAGRLPTDLGLRMYVNGFMEYGSLSPQEREDIEDRCNSGGRSMSEVLETASGLISGLSSCAGVVVAPKMQEPLKHLEFVSLGPGRALVVLVTANGEVENRVIELPLGLPPSALIEAGNYLSARLIGRTLEEAIEAIRLELQRDRAQLDHLAAKVVELGIVTWANDEMGDPRGALIVKGQSRLLGDITALEDLERVRHLFTALEKKESLIKLLDMTKAADGVQIFIGSENELFAQAGCSVVMAPYKNAREQVVGAIGVIGPTRIDYARIIPMVDYTAKVLGRMIG